MHDDIHKAWWKSLKPFYYTPQEFKEMMDYSVTIPTGAVPGKTWKRLDGSHDEAYLRGGGKPRWLICQYDPNAKPTFVSIKIFKFRPVIRIKATTNV